MNIILRELRANRKSLIIWGGSIVAIIVMMVSEFSAYYQNPDMADVIALIPEKMLQALSMSGADLTTVGGFVSMGSIYYYILLSVHAVLLGNTLLAKEERDKTAEFFLTLPVSRSRTVLMKTVAGVVLCLALNLITIATTIGTTLKYDKAPGFGTFILLMTVSLFLLQMIFLSIGMLLATVLRRHRQSSRAAVGLLFGLYALSVVISLTEKLDFLQYVTPFKYFEPGVLLRNHTLEARYVCLSVRRLSSWLTQAGTHVRYPRRDMHL